MKKKAILRRAAMTLALVLFSTAGWAADEPVTSYTATGGTEGVNADEGYAALVDNNGDTKWCVKAPGDSWTGTAYIEFVSDKEFVPTSYVLRTANDNAVFTGRNPLTWVVMAKRYASDEWTVIASVENDNIMMDTNFMRYEFALMTTSVYRFFRFEVSAVHDKNVLQLSEFYFIGHDDDGNEPTFTPPTIREDLVYTCKELELIQPGSAVGGEMQYSLNNVEWSAKLPKQTAVGEYPVYYRVLGDNTHHNTVSYLLGTASIKKAEFVDLSTIDYTYWATDGDILTGKGHPDAHILCGAGVTVTFRDIDLTQFGEGHDWAGFCVAGNATIILEGTNKLKGCLPKYPGLLVNKSNEVIIKGDGTLEVEAGGRAAAIGGGPANQCGRIVIDGGTIIARGGDDSPGIGGGPTKSCKGITINGGHVTAIGGKGAAGIGTGTSNSACNFITINGGTVIATKGENGVCIGAVEGSSCGTITIAPNLSDVTVGDTRTISETTAVSVVKSIANDATWYDMKGQSLQSNPTQKGIYIHDGKKMVVK